MKLRVMDVTICTLCQQNEEELKLGPLLNFDECGVSQLTFNIISIIKPCRLCTKCCQELALVGRLLFKWRQKIILALEYATEQFDVKKEEPFDADDTASPFIPVSINGFQDSLSGGENLPDIKFCRVSLEKLGNRMRKDCDYADSVSDTNSIEDTSANVDVNGCDISCNGKETAKSSNSSDTIAKLQSKPAIPTKRRKDPDPDWMYEHEKDNRGRPQGSRNKPKPTKAAVNDVSLESSIDQAIDAASSESTDLANLASFKVEGRRKRGRPRGSFKTPKPSLDVPKVKISKNNPTQSNASSQEFNPLSSEAHMVGYSPAETTKVEIDSFSESVSVPQKEGRFECPHCQKIFQRPTSFKKHVANHAVVYKCLVCGKAVRDKFSLGQHTLLHGEPSIRCDQCDQVFHTNTQFSVHKQKKHGGEKKNLCRFCPFKTWTRKDLRTHERIHTNERPYHCRFCHKRFKAANVLRFHEATHEKNRQAKWPCKLCDKLFICPRYAKWHEKEQHTPPKIPCPYHCGRMFRRNQKANNHARICALKSDSLIYKDLK